MIHEIHHDPEAMVAITGMISQNAFFGTTGPDMWLPGPLPSKVRRSCGSGGGRTVGVDRRGQEEVPSTADLSPTRFAIGKRPKVCFLF